MQDIKSKLYSLPEEIRCQEKFLLWKYDYSNLKAKPLKIPHVRKGKSIVRGLKGGGYWSFKSLLALDNLGLDFIPDSKKVSPNYFPGFYLYNSGLSVIDLDHYYYDEKLNEILQKMYQKGCYIEFSPSQGGIHIFYLDYLDWTDGRNRSDLSIDSGQENALGKKVQTTCEVYSSNDVRFITLTGDAIGFAEDEENPRAKNLPSAESLKDELLAFKKFFFSQDNSSVKKKSLSNFEGTPFYDYIEQGIFPLNLVDKFSELLDRMEKSGDYSKFIDLVNSSKLDHHPSVSEADLSFAGIIVRNLPEGMTSLEEHELSVMILNSYRRREKIENRPKYAVDTVSLALQNRDLYRLRNNNLSTKPTLVKQDKEIHKASVIKMCNITKIFHLGRPYKAFERIASKDSSNSLEATAPVSLNQSDFKYFMQILYQYKDSTACINKSESSSSEDSYFEINVRDFLQKLDLKPCGRAYNDFFSSLNKLSKVHLQYSKLIDQKNDQWCQSAGSLLSYQLFYEKNSLGETSAYRKLRVQMHDIFSDVILKGTYNYSLVNQESLSELRSDKLKLLYVYLCKKTLPGVGPVKMSLNDLINDLWPELNSQQLKYKRQFRYRRELELQSMIVDFIKIQSKMKDLFIEACYSGKTITHIRVRKVKLRLV